MLYAGCASCKGKGLIENGEICQGCNAGKATIKVVAGRVLAITGFGAVDITSDIPCDEEGLRAAHAKLYPSTMWADA